METMNVNAVIFGYKVTSIDLERRVCNLTVTVKRGDKVESKNLRDVPITGLLSYNLSNDVDGYEVGKYYESSLNSEDWKKNPFQLIRYSKGSGEDYEVKLLFACVHERNSMKLESSDIFGKKMVEYVNRFHKKSYYKRYRDYARS